MYTEFLPYSLMCALVFFDPLVVVESKPETIQFPVHPIHTP